MARGMGANFFDVIHQFSQYLLNTVIGLFILIHLFANSPSFVSRIFHFSTQFQMNFREKILFAFSVILPNVLHYPQSFQYYLFHNWISENVLFKRFQIIIYIFRRLPFRGVFAFRMPIIDNIAGQPDG